MGNKLVQILWKMAQYCSAILLLSSICVAQTTISGTIATNTQWNKANSPYNITGATSVAEGVVLNIEAGVTVNFISPLGIVVNGKVEAIGTPSDSIYFNTLIASASKLKNSKSFYLQNKGSLTLSYCRQQGAFYFTLLERNVGIVAVSHSVFSANEFIFFGKGGDNLLSIQDANFKNSKYAINNINVNVKNCIFENLENYALFQVGKSKIDKCTFRNVDNRAIEVNAPVAIQDCIFEGNRTAIFTQSIGEPFVLVRNKFLENTVALYFTGNAEIADSIYNNLFCNNIEKDIENPILNDTKLNLSNNCWCRQDTNAILARISNPEKAIVAPLHISCRPCEAKITKPLDSIICSNKNILFQGRPMPDMQVQWLPSISFASSQASNATFAQSNTTADTISSTIYYRVTNPAAGCTALDSVTIKILPKQEAKCRDCKVYLPKDSLIICAEKPVDIGWQASSPFLTYQWSPIDGLTGYKGFNPQLVLSNATEENVLRKYKVLVVDSAAKCTFEDSIVVVVLPLYSITCGVLPELHVYNIITPNDDDQNKTLFIENLKFYKKIEITIFNKWGQQVYDNKDYQNDWSGNQMPDGSYYCHVVVPELKKELRVNFMILRGD